MSTPILLQYLPYDDMPPSSSNIPKKRSAVTDDERVRLRKRHKEHPSQQSDLIKWWQRETGQGLDQSQISRILSAKYDYLDSLDQKQDKKRLQAYRTSAGDWPDLEAALFEWQQRLQKTDSVITGEVLKEQAAKFWNSLPQYSDKAQPKFSNGWLGGFKKRFKIREFVQHGEAGSADINNPDAIQQMEKVRTLVAEYGPDNTLNMDETGLF